MASLFESLAVTGHRKSTGAANASGRAWFYSPGTTNVVTVFSDADESSSTANPVTLDAGGKARVYFTDVVDVAFEDSTGLTLETLTLAERAERVQVANSGFTGLLPSGSQGAGGVTDLDTILSSIFASTGGLDGKYKEFTGATARTLQSVIRGIQVSVKDYGAVGNGIADDTTAIQNAVNEVARLGGGVVYFDPGTYLTSAAITLSSNTGVAFKGAGSGASLINLSNATANAVTITSCTTVAVVGLTIKHASASTGVGIAFTSCTGVSVDDLKVFEDDYAVGVQFDGCTRTAIVRSDIGCNDTGGGTGIAVNYTNTGSYHTLSGGTTLRGSATGICVRSNMGGSSGILVVTACHFVSGAVGVNVAAALDPVTVVACMGLDDMTTAFTGDTSGVLTQALNNVDGYTTGVSNGGNVTPNLLLGTDIRIDAAGATATVNEPTPAPAAGYGRRLLLRFGNHSGGTTWTMNAAFRLTAGIPTTANHRVHLLCAYDPDDSIWREIARADMAT